MLETLIPWHPAADTGMTTAKLDVTAEYFAFPSSVCAATA